MSSSRVLLVVPSMADVIYKNTRIRAATSIGPMVGFASMAACLIEAGHAVRVLDLDLHPEPDRVFDDALEGFRPDIVGIACQTATFSRSVDLARRARERGAFSVLGGPHSSALPEESLLTGVVDAVVIGEGEWAITRLADGEDPASIPGVALPGEGGARLNGSGEGPADLDELPLPAWQVFEPTAYAPFMSPLFTRRPPFANFETSRGCPFRCTFCTEAGTKYRTKSPARVVEEFHHAVRHGWGEIHVVDDLFSLDMDRAKEICRTLIAEGNDTPWTLDTGIRVDRIDDELAALLVRSGCWQIALGIESGERAILDQVTKAITPEKARRGVEIAHRAGLETIGLFIQGLPGETTESLERSIRFACDLPLDWATFRIAIPYPGTQLHEQWKRDGIIRTEDWSQYLRQPTGTVLYEHPDLPFRTLVALNERAYRDFYLRIGYAIRRFFTSLRQGTTMIYLKAFLSTPWRGSGRTELEARA